MKKTGLFLTFLLLGLGLFAQYTGNKLPSGLTVADTANDADYTIIQKSGETYVKAIRMDSLRSYMTEGMAENVIELDSVAGNTGQFIISDGSGWLAPVSAKYEGMDAYTFGYRTGTVGAFSFLTSGRPSLPNTASGQWSVAMGGYGSIASGTPSVAMLGGEASGGRSFSVGFGSLSSGIDAISFAGGEATGLKSFAFDAPVYYDNAVSFGGYGYAKSTFSTNNSTANSYGCISLGQHNDTIAASKTTWVTTDPLLYIGNGANSGSKCNALVMLKNGNTTANGNWTFDGNITADTVTAYVMSQSSFGEIWVADGAVAQSIPNGTTYTKMTGFVRTGSYENMIPDSTNDKITITETGYYLVNITMSSISGTNGVVSRTAAFLGGVEQDQIHAMQTITNTASPNPIACSGIIKVTTVPIDLDVRRRHDNGAPVNFTVVYANLTVHKLGGL